MKKYVKAGRTTNHVGHEKRYKNIKFSGWTKTKSSIIDALNDPATDTDELKRYVRYAISEAEAAETKLKQYREILERLNKSSYSAADRDVAISDLKSTTLSQDDLHNNNPTPSAGSTKSRKSNTWPSADEWWEVVEYGEEFEDMWDRYLAGPENEVNRTFKIFPEPSTQGGYGSMVIFDESEDENEPVYVDFQDWVDAEIEMAAESKNANEYATKYEIYLKSIIDWL